MSGQATGWVLRHGPHPEHIDRHGKPYGARSRGMRSVLTCVADAANADGKHAHPGIEGVMRGSLYSRRQSIILLDELVQEGWLGVEEAGGGSGKATVYWLPRMVTEKGAVIAPKLPETVQSDEKRVQSEAETVQSRLHPNGLYNGKEQRRAKVAPAPFPAQFLRTTAMIEWAMKNAPGVDLDYETHQFADYWRGRQDVKRTDWTASWRTWIRKAHHDQQSKAAKQAPKDSGQFQTMVDQWQTA